MECNEEKEQEELFSYIRSLYVIIVNVIFDN